jgi:glycosyltransferase 2 family protein
VQVQTASSFVNRVTPANVGGMALNVRYMQKAGVEPAAAVTGMGLNVIAGGIVHIGLLFLFLAWAGRSEGGGFSIPSSSKLLVAIAVVLALLGLLLATRWGRRFFRTKVLRFVKDSLSSMMALAHSPGRLLALFGGSIGVTLAYATALACAIAAFDGGVSYAQVGAVYLGSSVIAAAAPTPGGLGAMEAALVAGFTAIGMDSAIAVAAVLSYRLATFWLPILPGWLSFRHLDRRGLI